MEKTVRKSVFSEVITQRFRCMFDSVRMIFYVCLCENVSACVRETSGDSDVLHSSSVLHLAKQLDSSGHTHHLHIHKCLSSQCLAFHVSSSCRHGSLFTTIALFFFAHVFMFVNHCKCCLTIKAVDL